jgi:hypothetical protein
LRFEATPGKEFMRPYLEKTLHKKGLEEWLKVKAPVLKKKKKKSTCQHV